MRIGSACHRHIEYINKCTVPQPGPTILTAERLSTRQRMA